MFPSKTIQLAQKLIKTLELKGWMIVTAESCTGGLITGALTAIPGSSAAIYGGFVTYANAAKQAMVKVPPMMIENHGAVSEQVARAMAGGALAASGVNVAIAVTGIAGPGGASADKPVGLVHIGCSTRAKTLHREIRIGDIGRDAIRLATIDAALELVLETLAAQE